MIQRAAVISTGDELTTGRIVDTNANYLADQLTQIGIELAAVLTVGDVPERLEWAWRNAIAISDVVISTGGLGPTADDLTTETIARLTGRKLVFSQEVADHIRAFFSGRGRPMPENNLKQAMFPEGAEIIPNPVGTAPGFRLALTHERRTVHLIVLPGVPREMKPMMQTSVLPWLRANRADSNVYLTHSFQTFGITESALDEAVAEVISPQEARVSFRASFPEISVRLTVRGEPQSARIKLQALAERVRTRLGEYVYGEGETSMEAVIGELLTRRKLTLAIAESCTGGLIGHRVTNVPGSSRYLKADFVVYSNEAKINTLGVAQSTLDQHGAVSEQCVKEMAAGARKLACADVALATSGIAGPEGGTPDKPVGTVWIALDAQDLSVAKRYQMNGDRQWIKLLASQVGLDWIRRYALGLELIRSLPFRR
jgi:nicotinamide-nucleotide amidase